MCVRVCLCARTHRVVRASKCVRAHIYMCECVWLRVRRDSAGTMERGVTNPSLSIY